MQLSFDARIPDGLLAANALLNEKPHQGVPSWNLALHQGIDERNSTAAIGIRASAQLNRIWPRYTGKERDTESGLDYFGARYYSSNMGRFSSPDSSDGYYSDSSNPQSWNLYSYVQNNPLASIDPDGHDCIHINVDTGAYAGTDTGDCDNTTEERANSGHYVDGTVSKVDVTPSGQVTGYSGTTYSGNILSGSFATPLSYGPLEGPANQAGLDVLSNSLMGVRKITTPFLIGLTFFIPGALEGTLPEVGLGIGGVGSVKAVGSRRDPVDVPRGTNTSTTIGGRYYTGHAIDEMQSSGIVPSMVEETVTNGTSSPGNTSGTTVHTLDGLKVVTNSSGGVITAMPVGR